MEMHLSDSAKNKLAEDFAGIQETETGGGRYEKYLQLIDQLKSEYL